MNDQTIQMIAQAIIANTKVLQTLVESLPRDVQQQVAQAANVAAPAPVAQAPAPVAAPVAPPAPVVPPVAAPTMPAPPTFTAPAPVAAPAAPVVSGAPFSDTQGLIQYVMSAYQAMGPEKGSRIQGILQSLGCSNINDLKPESFGALYQGVEALKVSA